MSVNILNVSHDTATTRVEWIENLTNLYADAFPSFERRFGFAYHTNADGEFELSDGFFSPDNLPADAVMGILSGFNASADQKSVQNLFNEITCASLTQRLGELKAQHLLKIPQAFDIEDVVAISCGNFDGTGFLFASFHETKKRISKKVRREWMCVAAHVAAMARIRLGYDRSDYMSLAEWIYDKKTGRVVDAKNSATKKSISDRLIHASKTIDRNRVSKDIDTVKKWEALTEGRWTLLDVADGPQNYVIAMPNDPKVREVAAMTNRQSQVLWFLLQGHSQAFVAYELGITESAVSRVLGSLRKKFGVKTTVELLRLTRGVLPQNSVPENLSAIHKELIDCVARGLSDAEIAAHRNRSIKTIRNQLHSTYRHLGVNSRAEMVAKFAF